MAADEAATARARARPSWRWPCAAGATEAEALVSADDAALTRFANSEIHQNVAETNVSLQPALRHRPAGRASPRPAGSTTRACARLVERAGAIARNVEELEDWAGLPGARAGSDRASCRRPTARRHGRRHPRAPRRGRPGRHRRGRRRRRHRLRLVRDDDGAIAVANSRGRRGGRRRGRRRSSSPSSMGPDGGTGYAEAAAVDATTIDAAALGREAAAQGPRDRQRPVASSPATTRSSSRSTPSSTSLDMLGYLGFSRPRGPGGALVRRARQADRQRPRDDRRRRARPGRPADGVRLRGRRQAAGRAPRSRASAATSCTTRQTAARDGVRVDRPRPAGPEPVGPVPAEHGDVGRDDAARGADRRAGPRPARDPLPLHEPGPPEARRS